MKNVEQKKEIDALKLNLKLVNEELEQLKAKEKARLEKENSEETRKTKQDGLRHFSAEYKNCLRVIKFKEYQIETRTSLETDTTIIEGVKPLWCIRADLDKKYVDLNRTKEILGEFGMTEQERNELDAEINLEFKSKERFL